MSESNEEVLQHAHASVMVRVRDLAWLMGVLESYYDDRPMTGQTKDAYERCCHVLGLEPRKAVRS